MDDVAVEIVPFAATYSEWARQMLRQAWGSTRVVSRGQIHEPLALAGFVALAKGHPVGLVTYLLVGDECELITLNSTRPGLGIGTALLEAVKDVAGRLGCRRLWLITTNDNLAALRFYQRRGFTLAALHRNALEISRRLKPELPTTGADGIPLRDEIELEFILGENDARDVPVDHRH